MSISKSKLSHKGFLVVEYICLVSETGRCFDCLVDDY